MSFVIPVVINFQGHRFEVYTMVSEIHNNVDVVMGIKHEMEGVFNIRDSILFFLKRSIHFFHKMDVFLKPREKLICSSWIRYLV